MTTRPYDPTRSSPSRILARLLRYRFLFIGLPLLLAVTAFVSSKLAGPRYSSQSRFVPQRNSDGISPLATLGAQFGITLPGMSGSGESLEFYAELVQSPGLLRKAVLSEYPLTSDTTSKRSLVELYGGKGENQEQRIRQAIQRLDEDLTAGSVARTGIITINATAETPVLAVAINQRLLDLVNEFNLESRQSKASAERRFVEDRLSEARQELTAAERTLTSFHEQNRRIEGSPELRSRAADLERQVSFRQQVYTSLAQAVEEARIREVRNTPVITTVDAPGDWVRRTSRPAVVSAVLAGMLGFIIALIVALVAERLAVDRAENPTAWQEIRQQLTLRPARRS